MKKQRGITLIALVITIIVLLILAGVSITMIAGDDGILNRAAESKEKTDEKSAYETIDLVISEWALEEAVGEKTLEEYLNSKVENGTLDKITKDEINNTYLLEKNGYTKAFGSSETPEEPVVPGVPETTEIPKVGDYVNYTPAGTAYSTNYNVETTYSGYSSNQLIYQQNSRWRILEIDGSKIVLVSEASLGIGNTEGNKTKFYLQGGDGYNNGVDLLNIACETLYSNSSIGAVARSIRQSDLDKYSTYDKTEFTSRGGNYGDVFNATNRYTPSLFVAEKLNNNPNGIGREENVGLGTYTGASKKNTTVLIEEDWYRFKDYCTDSTYLELLGDNDNYWTATRSVIIDNDTGTGTNIYPCFSVGKYTLVEDKYGFSSNGFLLKPVVEIPNVTLTIDEENSTDDYNYWDL